MGAESLSDDALHAVIDRARRLSELQPEPYQLPTFQTLLGHFLSMAASESAAESTVLQPGLAFTKFLTELKVSTHPIRVLVIAYYQECYSAGPPVTTHDLTDAYQRARIKPPQNFPDVIASVVRKGWLIEKARREGLKSWGITTRGTEQLFRGSSYRRPALRIAG